jgi:DNA topoisomerase III
MTSVSGHLTSLDFADRYRKWETTPPGQLFEAETVVKIDPVSFPDWAKPKTSANESRSTGRLPITFSNKPAMRRCYSSGLIVTAKGSTSAPKFVSRREREMPESQSNVPDSAIQNARTFGFPSHVLHTESLSHVIQAAQSPVELDDRQASAVATRIELDLRIGAAFTRLQTLQLKSLGDLLSDKIISYGSCQFPTLGFVVDRYFRVKNFKPETFWAIKVTHRRDGVNVNFAWRRVHLFDRAVVTIIFEKCLDFRLAKVTKVQKKPTSKWRPLPLTTVELQMQGSRFLRMDSKKVMRTAEQLYQRGWISYPRTETDQFSADFNLRSFIEKQTQDHSWGAYARGLLDGAFIQPRQGRNNDQAHPPIHPVNYVAPGSLSDDERRVYEFVVRRFLACCSEDAKGEATDIDIEWGEEVFHTHGLLVVARNYLDIYVYDKWESSQQLPQFQMGETFEPTEANMTDGKTTAPGYLTEPELIGLMDANGIGTDATMADHVAMIKDRDYAAARPKPGGGRNSVHEFIPTRLGVALVEGYDNLGLEVSVSKPFLRKEIELKIKAICEGRKTKAEVVHESIEEYREVFGRTQRNIGVLKRSVRRYVFDDNRE